MKRNGKLQAVGVLAGLALVSGVVLQVSSAAFTSTTENAGNSWDAGTVTLTDNDSDTALFSVTGLAPEDTGNNCIEVTYSGSIAPGAAVSLHAAVTETIGGSSGDGLGDDLDIVVKMGTAGTSCALIGTPTSIYTGTLAAFNTSASALSTGWTPTLGVDTMRPFQITYTLGSDTANDAQEDGADATFTWSATS